MKEYETIEPITLVSGDIRFEDKKFVRRFKNSLEEIKGKKDVFRIMAPISLKKGLVFHFSGDIDRRSAHSLAEVVYEEDESDEGKPKKNDEAAQTGAEKTAAK